MAGAMDVMCRYPECPWKDEPHIPWCGEIGHYGHTNVGTDQHRPRKGMGGNNPASKIVAVLCPALHDAVDNGLALGGVRYKDEIRWVEGHKFYRLFDPATEHTEAGWALIWREIPEGEVLPRALVESFDANLKDWEDRDATLHTGERTRNTASASGEAEPVLLPDLPEGLGGGGDADAEGGHAVVPLEQGVGELTFDDWAERLRSTVRLHQSMGFVIGDLLVYGEDKFGEQAYQVIDQELQMAPQTIANWMNVCRAIPPAVRTWDVPFSVYAEAAPVFRQDAQEGARLMSRAEAEGLTKSAVRAIVAPPERVELCRCPTCGKEHRP